MDKKFPLRVTANVPVIIRLSSLPSIVTEVLFLFVIVSFLIGIYFSGAWSMFMMRVSGILNSSIRDTMSWWKRNSISFLAPSGMSTLNDVLRRFANPIRLNKLAAQRDKLTSISPTTPGFRLIRTFASALAIVVLITPPRLLKVLNNFTPFCQDLVITIACLNVKNIYLFVALAHSFLLKLFWFRPRLSFEWTNITLIEMWEFTFKFSDGSDVLILQSIFPNGISIFISPSEVRLSILLAAGNFMWYRGYINHTNCFLIRGLDY